MTGSRAHGIETRNQAMILIIEKRYSCKKVAKTLKINERTIGRWIKEYGWLNDHRLYPKSLTHFMLHIEKYHPDINKEIAAIYIDFINQ